MDIIKYIAVYIGIIAAIWLLGVVFSSSIRDYEIITPKDGVECVVVSRMFNTSVDCWVTTE